MPPLSDTRANGASSAKAEAAAREQTELAIDRAGGRKDGDGQEAVIKTKPFKQQLQDLVALEDKASAAAEKYNKAVKLVAERSGLLSSVVKKFVGAYSGGVEKFADEKSKVAQLDIVFREIGGPKADPKAEKDAE